MADAAELIDAGELAEDAVDAAEEPQKAPRPRGKRFLELSPRDCKFLLGRMYDPAEFFCGAPPVGEALL